MGHIYSKKEENMNGKFIYRTGKDIKMNISSKKQYKKRDERKMKGYECESGVGEVGVGAVAEVVANGNGDGDLGGTQWQK